MRRLRRPQFPVPTMLDTGPGGKRRLDDRRHFETTGAVPANFPPHWTKPDVRGLLHAMQGRVCAYCGMGTNGLDVEHFRPKGSVEEDQRHGGYWWLAYECSNYFLGCTVCNQKRKQNSFPIRPGTARCTYAARDTIGAEGRVLLDPADDPVEEWLALRKEDVTAFLVPNPNLSAASQSRVREAIEFLGLNLEPEVRDQRSWAYEQAARAASEKRWEDLRRSAMRHRPHSLPARIVLQKLAPKWLPTPEDELKDLVDLLWNNLRVQVRLIQDLSRRAKIVRRIDVAQMHILGWALIALRSDPPAGDRASLDSYLAELLKQEATEVQSQIVRLFRHHARRRR
jgi:uncharacterized protein (TIGR02646 family)